MKVQKWLILMVVLSMTASLLIACSLTDKPDRVVEKAFQALKKNDQVALAEFIDLEDPSALKEKTSALNTESGETVQAILSKLDIKILSTKIDKNTAVVQTEVTALDMKSVLGEYISQAFSAALSSLGDSANNMSSEEDYEQLLLDLIKEETATVTSTVDVKLNKTDGDWKIVVDDTIADAILGGMLSAANDLADSFNESSD